MLGVGFPAGGMRTKEEELMPEPCSGIPVPRWGIAPLDADGKAGSFVVGPYGDPSAMFDLEGDGQWELLVAGDGYISEPELLTITPEGIMALTTLPSVPKLPPSLEAPAPTRPVENWPAPLATRWLLSLSRPRVSDVYHHRIGADPLSRASRAWATSKAVASLWST